MIDIGANLSNNSFKDDLPKVIQRAKNANIQAIIVTGTSIESSDAAQSLCNQYPEYLFATAGIHPHDADSYNEEIEQQLHALLSQSCVVAAGETGLDYNRNFSTPANQRQAFEAQIALASHYKKPLFLHERDAFDDFYSILRQHKAADIKAVVHCFTGSKDALRAYLDLGLSIGITGWICDKKRGANLREIINYAPLDRLMIETDAPYLTPHNKNVKEQLKKKHRNEPWTLSYTANTLAECLAIDTDTLIAATSKNAADFFSIDLTE